MFPLFQGNELCFQISSNPQDLILPTTPPPPHHTYHAPPSTLPAAAPGAPRRRKKPAPPSAPAIENYGGGRSRSSTATADCGQDHKKKMMHREIERQRRQEMATLYASLRSLLPLEFIKGRRSMSDHMSEAVNYIKQLQKGIQGLDAQRNQLIVMKKATCSTLTDNSGLSGAIVLRPDCSVEVRRCLGGLEIVVASPSEGGGGLRLSRVLRLLLEEGVSVVNCVSTVVNRKCFHTLVAEVEEPTSFNVLALQQKLLVSS